MINLIVIRCLAGVVGLFGLFLVGMGLLTLWKGIQMSAWPSVEGVVTACRLQERREQVAYSDRSTRTMVSFEPMVDYYYSVDGQNYAGQRISPIEKRFARQLAQKMLDRYPVGTPIHVRYNPQNPAEAFLSVSVSWSGLGFVLAGVALIAAAIWMATPAG